MEDSAFLKHIDTIIGLFRGQADAAPKVREISQNWHRCEYTAARVVRVAVAELQYQQKTGDPLDAYRTILLQEYVQRN